MGPIEIASTLAITSPYTFEAITIPTPSTPPLLPDFTSVEFVNSVGSNALTMFSMVEALNFLAILVLIYLAIRVLIWLYGYITGQPTDTKTIDVTGALEDYAKQTGDTSYKKYAKLIRQAKNPFR